MVDLAHSDFHIADTDEKTYEQKTDTGIPSGQASRSPAPPRTEKEED